MGATGVMRFRIFAGTTSIAAGGSAAGAATGGIATAAEPPAGGLLAPLALSGVAGTGARIPEESLASSVRPLNELSLRRAAVVGGELIGASSGMVCVRGASPIGAP